MKCNEIMRSVVIKKLDVRSTKLTVQLPLKRSVQQANGGVTSKGIILVHLSDSS